MFFSFRNLLKNFSKVVNIITNILFIQSLKRSGQIQLREHLAKPALNQSDI